MRCHRFFYKLFTVLVRPASFQSPSACCGAFQPLPNRWDLSRRQHAERGTGGLLHRPGTSFLPWHRGSEACRAVYYKCGGREQGNPAVRAHGTDWSGEPGVLPAQGRRLRPARPLWRRSGRAAPATPALPSGAGGEKRSHSPSPLPGKTFLFFGGHRFVSPLPPAIRARCPPSAPLLPAPPAAAAGAAPSRPAAGRAAPSPPNPAGSGRRGDTHAAVVPGPVHHGLVVRRVAGEGEGGAAQPQLLQPEAGGAGVPRLPPRGAARPRGAPRAAAPPPPAPGRPGGRRRGPVGPERSVLGGSRRRRCRWGPAVPGRLLGLPRQPAALPAAEFGPRRSRGEGRLQPGILRLLAGPSPSLASLLPGEPPLVLFSSVGPQVH